MLAKRGHRLSLIIIVAALVGLLDTIYLTVSHFRGGEVVCSLVEGCNLVLASSWATLLGIPTAMLGAVFYLLILIFIALIFYLRSQAALLAVVATATVGFILSLGFLYLQIFVIGAICEYCLLSLLATTVIWAATLGLAFGRSSEGL